MHLILGSTIPDINDAVDERDGKLCKFLSIVDISYSQLHFQHGNEYRLLH